MDRFCWHAAARVFDGKGAAVDALTTGAALISERPSGRALALALASGTAFRIGGDGAAPAQAAMPMFETLTSGSSGSPRRIWRSQASWIRSFRVNAGLFGIGPGSKVAVLGRLVHSLSLYGALEALHLGGEVHLLDDLRPDRQRLTLSARRIGVLYATPAQLRLLIEAGGDNLPDLRLVLVGGSKLDAGLRADLGKLAPAARVREFYGAAETSFISLAREDSPAASVGVPYPGVDIEVRAKGTVVSDDQSGEIWVRSPYLFDSYAGADPGSALFADGWLSVGEIGYQKQGHLYLAGRAGRMVTIADQNVFPEEIEAFLATLTGVRRVAVVPRPDKLRGTVLVAVAMGDQARQDIILHAARGRFGPLKAPRDLVWRTDWPVLASGKTDLARIEQELQI